MAGREVEMLAGRKRHGRVCFCKEGIRQHIYIMQNVFSFKR